MGLFTWPKIFLLALNITFEYGMRFLDTGFYKPITYLCQLCCEIIVASASKLKKLIII